MKCSHNLLNFSFFSFLQQAIEAWIQDTSVPLIWEFTGTNAQKIFAQKAKTHFLYFITVEDVQKQVEPLKSVAVEYKDKITFVYINVQEKSNEQVMKFFGIDDKMVPMYTLFEVNIRSLKLWCRT